MKNNYNLFSSFFIVLSVSMLFSACTSIQSNPPFSESHVLAFTSEKDIQVEIYMLELSDMTFTNITNTPDVSELTPSWLPDQSGMVYVASGFRDRTLYIELEMLDFQSGSVEGLTTVVAAYGDPSISPDLSKILFYSTRDLGPEDAVLNREIYVMDANTRDVIRLTDSQGDDIDPVWSPDGTRIAFVSERTGNKDVYIMNADGSNLINLTDSPSEETEPGWSPNGKQLVFVSDKPGNKDLFIINVDGTNETNLTNSGQEETEPAWSPDGVWIAFVSREGEEQSEIFVINPDGNAKTRITDHWANDYSPTWKPIQLSN